MKRKVVVDTETTGLDTVKGRHRVIEIALVEIINNKITGKSFQSYFSPDGRKSAQNALKVHKIKDAFLLDKPLFKDQLNNILAFIADSELVFYNKAFDLKFLDNEAKISGSPVCFSTDYKTTCVQEIVVSGLDNQRKISLDNACRMYGIDISKREVHGALIDTTLTAQLYLEIAKRKTLLNKVTQKRQRTKPEKFPLSKSYEGYQINYCKSPQCANYGVSPRFPKPITDGEYDTDLGNYKLSIIRPKRSQAIQLLTCKICNTGTLVFSNKAIVQEVKRLNSLYTLDIPSCSNTGLLPNKRKNIPDGRRYEKITKTMRGKEKEFTKLKPACPHQDKNIIEYSDLYWLDSKNTKKIKNVKGLPKVIYPDALGKYQNSKEAVSQTFKCKACHTKFSTSINPQKGQHNQQINYQLFSMLVNKGIINRMAEILRINHNVIYSRIEFFHKQCIEFEQFQLMTNLHKLKNKHVNLSIDRQMFNANWSSKTDARRTLLINTSTVDNNSRYVFGSTLNFDFTSDYKSLSKEFVRIGEYEKEPFKRRYQQYNLPEEEITDNYDLTTPNKHLLISPSYSVISHLEFLKPTFEKLGSINIYGDNDTILDTAITKVFKDLINNKKIKACITRTSKLKQGETEFDKGYVWMPQDMPVIDGNYLDLKPLTDYDERFLNSASLHGVDNYFQLLRRRISMVERPFKASTNKNAKQLIENDLSSSGSKFEKWNLYGSYNPKYVSMLIEIFRVFNNFILTDEKTIKNTKDCNRTPKTPAQKIGLSENIFDIHDILEFSVANIVVDLKEKQ